MVLSMGLGGLKKVFAYLFRRCLGAAFRAWATGDRTGWDGNLQVSLGEAGESRSLADEAGNSRVGQAVENVLAFALGDHQAAFAQQHELLRDIGLAVSQPCFQVAYTRGLPGNCQENPDPGRLGQQTEYSSGSLKGK